jgi:hypothetical protein
MGIRITPSAASRQTEHVSEAPASSAPAAGRGFATADESALQTTAFTPLRTPHEQRRGFTILPFSNSPSVELEGFGDLAAATKLLEPIGLVPVPTKDGRARVSVAAIHYRFFGGLMKGTETWLSVVARKQDGGPPGQAYLATVADKWILEKIGKSFGIPYERATIDVRASESGAAGVVIGDPEHPTLMLMRGENSRRPTSIGAQETDFPGFSPTGKTMEVHMEGEARRRSFDLAADRFSVDPRSLLGQLTTQLGFKPHWWTTQASVDGGIRARF